MRPVVVALKPGGWAMRFDGTEEGGRAIAGRIWSGLSADVLRHHWTFAARVGGQSVWKTPGRNGSVVSAEKDAWITYYQETYRVLNALPSDWLDGTTPFTRNILDEWQRR
jgi:hypothetical protein